MDFSHFIPQNMIGPLHWLGRRNWVEHGDIPDRRQVWGRPKELVFLKQDETPLTRTGEISLADGIPGQPWTRSPEKMYVHYGEYSRYPREHWEEVKRTLGWLRH